MINRAHKLPISRQAELLGISRVSVYYLPRPGSKNDLTIIKSLFYAIILTIKTVTVASEKKPLCLWQGCYRLSLAGKTARLSKLHDIRFKRKFSSNMPCFNGFSHRYPPKPRSLLKSSHLAFNTSVFLATVKINIEIMYCNILLSENCSATINTVTGLERSKSDWLFGVTLMATFRF